MSIGCIALHLPEAQVLKGMQNGIEFNFSET